MVVTQSISVTILVAIIISHEIWLEAKYQFVIDVATK